MLLLRKRKNMKMQQWAMMAEGGPAKTAKDRTEEAGWTFFFFLFFPPEHQQRMFQRLRNRFQNLLLPSIQNHTLFAVSLKHEKSASLKSLLDSCSLFSTLKCKQWGYYIQYNLHRVLLSICSIRKTLIKIEKALQLAHAIDSDSCNALVRTAWYCTSPIDAPLFSPSQFPVPIWSSHLFFPLTRYFMGRWTNQSETK